MTDITLQHVLSDLRPLYASTQTVLRRIRLRTQSNVASSRNFWRKHTPTSALVPDPKARKNRLWALTEEVCTCTRFDYREVLMQRGLETYHFCYFFRKTEPYSLLIKVGWARCSIFSLSEFDTEKKLCRSSCSQAKPCTAYRPEPSKIRKTRPEE